MVHDTEGAVRNGLNLCAGATSGDRKLSDQAARSIGPSMSTRPRAALSMTTAGIIASNLIATPIAERNGR